MNSLNPHSQSHSPADNCGGLSSTTFTGKERDGETGFGYFGARYMDHELTTMWLSVDPMSDKYPSISPYNYCAWSPVKLVDPDGKDVWEINRKGVVTRCEKSNNTKMYFVDEKGNRTKQFVQLSNDNIVAQLSIPKKKMKTEDAEGTTTWRGFLRTATSSNKDDIVKIFDFAARNTDVEWGIYAFCKDNNSKYGICTYQKDDRTPSFSCFSDMKDWGLNSCIHSHPNPRSLQTESESLFGDRSVARNLAKNRSTIFYGIYMSKSQNLYKIDGNGVSSCIGKQSDYKSLLKFF